MTWNRRITPEGHVKQGIRQYLRLKGWKVYPIMQGPLSHPGLSDFFAIKSGKTIFIEAKTKTGRQSIHQQKFQAELEAEGISYLLIRNFEELKELGY